MEQIIIGEEEKPCKQLTYKVFSAMLALNGA